MGLLYLFFSFTCTVSIFLCLILKDVGNIVYWNENSGLLSILRSEFWYSFKASIIRRLTSSCCFERMLWEWILVPRAAGRLPHMKVTEILPILHDIEGGWTEYAGWGLETESHCCLGFQPALLAPVSQIGFTQQNSLLWETEQRQQAAETWRT